MRSSRLPQPAVEQLCTIFNRAEEVGYLPEILCQSWTALIGEGVVPKGQGHQAQAHQCVELRLQDIYVNKTSSLRQWLDDTFPACICSYLTHRDARRNMMEVMKDIEHAQCDEAGEDVVIVSLDASKAFPSVSRVQLARIL